jgi:hypothetical protein
LGGAARSACDYAWFTHAQVGWYRQTARDWKERTGRVLPALAFFHIPFPELLPGRRDFKTRVTLATGRRRTPAQ